MPFVSDIAGPQRPVHDWPRLLPGAMRRTSTIDTHPDGPSSADVDLRARDVVVDASGAVDVVDDVVVRAHLTDRAIDEIDGVDERLSRLRAVASGRVSAPSSARCSDRDVERSTLLALLLDDWAGASLVSGYATQHLAITSGTEQKLPDGVADRMGGICAGFALDASSDRLRPRPRRHSVRPRTARAAADRRCRRDAPGGTASRTWHAEDAAAGPAIRTMTTSVAFDAHFRDSHVDEAGVETIVHEYSVVGQVDARDRTLSDVDGHRARAAVAGVPRRAG